MNKHGGYYGQKKDVLDFSVNLNPLGVPETVRTFMMEQLQRLEYYPEPTSIEAREALGNKLLLKSGQVIMGNGATELIYLFARTIQAKRVLLLQPTFNEYERAFKQYGAQCTYHYLQPEDSFSLNCEMLLDEIRLNKPEVVVICNPNNPTGSYIESEKIEEILLTLNRYNGYLLVDESFAEFENQGTAISLLEHPKLLLIRSLTKFYAIAGIRLGYGLGHEALIEQMNDYKEPWTLNGFASHMVPYLLQDKAYQDQTQTWYFKEKAYMEEQLKTIPFLTVFPSYANFFLCRTFIPNKILMKELMKYDIYIRTCEDFKGLKNEFVRLALRSRPENEQLIKALKNINLFYSNIQGGK